MVRGGIMGIAAEEALVNFHSPRRNRIKSTHPHATAKRDALV
ncbi:unnamed protein product [marine sediment metagenome]|uniref:Uncharacterized protein n=1 Tax=marine sediment metagenome TaxID=412755 RepID=X1RP22_9ZZZZ